MHKSTGPTALAGPPTSVSDTPDWDNVPFAVGCPRCGVDLRGRTEPVCPACSLRFHWSNLILRDELRCRHCDYRLYGLRDGRCPECGNEFTWESVLHDHHRSRKPLFEYHWRESPVRSWLRTCSLSLRPWKLWRVIELHDRPAISGLLAMLIPTFAMFFLIPLLFHLAALVVMAETESRWQPPAFRPPLGRAVFSGFPTGWWALSPIFHRGMAGWLGRSSLFVGSGLAGTCFGLLILRFSMHRCRVRDIHILRAVAYALIPAATGWLVWHFVVTCRDVYTALDYLFTANVHIGGARSFRQTLPVLIALAVITLLWTVLSLALAYRRYIRMNHAEGVAVAGLSIGIMVGLLADLACRGAL